MNELASDAVRTEPCLVVGDTFFGLVKWIINRFLTKLVLPMGVLALVAIATGLGPAPLSAHFRFIFALVDCDTTFLGLLSGVESEALDTLELRWGLDHELWDMMRTAFVTGITTVGGSVKCLFITCRGAI